MCLGNKMCLGFTIHILGKFNKNTCCNTFLLLAFKTFGCLISSQSCKANEYNNLKIVCQVSLCNLKLNISLCHFGQQSFIFKHDFFLARDNILIHLVLYSLKKIFSFATIKAFWWNIMYISFWVVGKKCI
jgi:hypothetical protein